MALDWSVGEVKSYNKISNNNTIRQATQLADNTHPRRSSPVAQPKGRLNGGSYASRRRDDDLSVNGNWQNGKIALLSYQFRSYEDSQSPAHILYILDYQASI